MKYAKPIYRGPIRTVYLILVLASVVFTPVARATDLAHQTKPHTGHGGPLRGSAPTDLPLWYNGDYDGGQQLHSNGLCLVPGDGYNSHVYDDFIVTSANGWTVTSVFSDSYLQEDSVPGATWEIRQNVSAGDGGQVVASGFTYAPVLIDLPNALTRTVVTGLDIQLAPGTYWLNVTPAGYAGDFGGNYSDAFITMGANCVGTPCGNDGNSFSYSPELGEVWTALNADWPMGVNGISCPGNCALILNRAVSFRIAPSGQSEPILLPLSGQTGVEDRSSVPRGNYMIQMTFTQNITSTAHVNTSCGRVASTSIDGGTLTVNLTGVQCNAVDITVTANDVKDDTGQNLGSASATMGILVGDVDGNRIVDQNDLTIIRSELGQSVNDTNFRSDVNGDGQIDELDIQLATRQLGTVLPP